MNIILSENSGFCPGVKRADHEIHRLISERTEGERIFTLGKLIHNDIYISELKNLGVESIPLEMCEPLLMESNGAKTTVVIRTHGITRETEKYLYSLKEKYPNLNILDMTCPTDKKINKIAAENTNENTLFLIFFHEQHPDSQGIIS